jgi:hypothetical protein
MAWNVEASQLDDQRHLAHALAFLGTVGARRRSTPATSRGSAGSRSTGRAVTTPYAPPSPTLRTSSPLRLGRLPAAPAADRGTPPPPLAAPRPSHAAAPDQHPVGRPSRHDRQRLLVPSTSRTLRWTRRPLVPPPSRPARPTCTRPTTKTCVCGSTRTAGPSSPQGLRGAPAPRDPSRRPGAVPGGHGGGPVGVRGPTAGDRRGAARLPGRQPWLVALVRRRGGARPRPRLPPRRRRSPRVAVQALFRSGSVIAPMQAAGTSQSISEGSKRAEPRQGPPARQRRTEKACGCAPINGTVRTGGPGRSPLRRRSSWWRPWRRQASGGEVRARAPMERRWARRSSWPAMGTLGSL